MILTPRQIEIARLLKQHERRKRGLRRRLERKFRPLVYCDDYLQGRGGPIMRHMTDAEIAALPPGEFERLRDEALTFRLPDSDGGEA